MANTVSSFWQTVINALTEATQVLAPTWKASQSVYVDYRPEPATIGQTLNVVLPSDPKSSVADAGVADVNLTDISFSTKSIVFNKHPLFAFVVRDFEQFNSPQLIREAFLDGAIKGVKSNINAAVTGLFTSGNFNVNTVQNTTSHIITTAQALSAAAILADQNVPIADDPNNVSLLVPSVPYYAILGDSNWTQAQIAGMYTAEKVRATGIMPVSYGWQNKLDQQMPIAGTAPSRTFTGILMHRWAVAIASRPLPQPDPSYVKFTYVDFDGISIRVSMAYNHYPKQGWVIEVDAGYGLAVVRPEMGILFSTAE